ncbi:MAG: hypothetical protein ACUZ8H_14600, partial [Candidatus Anammoxibacter sp.]
MYKKILCVCALLLAVVSFNVITSDSSAIAANGETGKVVVATMDSNGSKLANGTFLPFFSLQRVTVITIDSNWNELTNVPYSLDGESFETNRKGLDRKLVSTNEEHTIVFGAVEGHTISNPQDGEITFTVKTTSKKIIGTYIKDSITTVQFEPTECKHELAPDSNTSCGFVLVPENR